jgi:hypothetical protein
LNYYRDRHFRKADGTFDIRPLPSIVEDILNANYAMPHDISKTVTVKEAGLALYPAEYFSPKNIHIEKINITTNTYTIHHYDGSWISKNFAYQAKQALHHLLIFLAGQKGHNSIVKLIRNMQNK